MDAQNILKLNSPAGRAKDRQKDYKMAYIVYYDNKPVGSVVSNQSLTDQDVIRLAGIDTDSTDPYGADTWEWELFRIDSVDQREYENYLASQAAAQLGRKGGKSNSEAKQQAARANGLKGGRPKNPKS